MDVKYIGGDVPWTLPFGDHFYSASETTLIDTRKSKLISNNDLDTIARRYDFEPLFSGEQTQSETKLNTQWMNAGVLFTDKTIKPELTRMDRTDFVDNHGHTFCYLCSINAHEHERTQPRDQSRRRKLIPYNNPKALKARPASADRYGQDPNDPNLIPYRFIVRTGAGKNSGTHARVFLYMYGTESNWTSINLQSRAVNNVDGFPRGSTRTFCLKGPEIGQLHHLNVNLVGARSDKEWFLKEIEITNLNTSVTWLCEFNCWLPKKSDNDEGYRVKPTVNPQKELPLENLSVYILQVRTGGKPFAGTDSNIHVLIRGSTGQTRRLALTSNRSNLFEQNQLDAFAIIGWDIGNLQEITVDSDRTQMAADWDLKEMIMWKIIPSDGSKQIQAYFPFNAWLGKKESTLKAKREAYAPAEPHPRGPTCYHIAVKTGKKMSAGTDANVFIIIYGKSGRTTIHKLDNPGINDFEAGKTSEFTIMDMDVGKVDQIKIWHDNSGPAAGWFLDSVVIRKKHSTCRPVTTIFIQRLHEASQALYRRVREQLQKLNQKRALSSKDSDRHSLSSKNINDELASNRSILRGSTMGGKPYSQKSVQWDERGGGSQENLSKDPRQMKSLEEKRRKADLSTDLIESGHFEHNAHWISSHNYNNKKWEIQSIEEQNPLNLDSSTRSLLLEDRNASNKKIKSTVNEREDDVYEFEANRWLAKDEGDKKTEVYLTPKSTKLSTETTSETKSKSPSDSRYGKYGSEMPDRASGSPRNLSPLGGSPRDIPKTNLDDSRTSASKRQELVSNANDYRPSSSQRDLLAKMSREPVYHPRSAAASAIDSGSSRFKPMTRFDNDRDYTRTTPPESATTRPKSGIRSVPELPLYRPTRSQVYSSAYGTIPMDDE